MMLMILILGVATNEDISFTELFIRSVKVIDFALSSSFVSLYELELRNILVKLLNAFNINLYCQNYILT